MREIFNTELTLADIPGLDAEWEEIEEFALTFNGYEVCGSFERCADIANAKRHDTLTNQRACLFFEQRRWRHFAREPDHETMTYLRGLIEMIRCHVLAGDVA